MFSFLFYNIAIVYLYRLRMRSEIVFLLSFWEGELFIEQNWDTRFYWQSHNVAATILRHFRLPKRFFRLGLPSWNSPRTKAGGVLLYYLVTAVFVNVPRGGCNATGGLFSLLLSFATDAG